MKARADFQKPVWPHGFDPPAGVEASLEKAVRVAARAGMLPYWAVYSQEFQPSNLRLIWVEIFPSCCFC